MIMMIDQKLLFIIYSTFPWSLETSQYVAKKINYNTLTLTVKQLKYYSHTLVVEFSQKMTKGLIFLKSPFVRVKKQIDS